jgi:hypothetical protein
MALRYYSGMPIHLAPINQPSTHSINSPEEDIRIPLQLQGIISLIETRTQTEEELNTCERMTLTSDATWEQYSNTFKEHEELASLKPITRGERVIHVIYQQQHLNHTCFNDMGIYHHS